MVLHSLRHRMGSRSEETPLRFGSPAGWVVAAAAGLGLAGGGLAGVWFWAHPFNSSVWHMGLGVVVLGVCAVAGLLVGAGRENWVLVGSLVLGGGIVAVTAVASGALPGVLAAAWITAVGVGVGEWILQRAGFTVVLGVLSRLVLGGAVGLGVLALGVLAVGLAGGLRRPLLWAALALVTLAVWPSLRRLGGAARRRWRAVHAEFADGGLAFAGIVAAALVLCLLGAWLWALAPSVWYDELNYQVAAPALYAREGAVVDRGEEFRFIWAHNANMLFTLGIVVGGLKSAKLIHFSLGLLAALAVLATGRKVAGERVGWLAAVLFLALPIVSWEMGVAYVDLGVTFFFAAALVAALHAVERGGYRWATLTGVVCGLAVGTKLNAGLLVAPLGAVLVGALLVRWGWWRALIGGACLAGGALAVVVPWLARDWAWTGNPVFPYLNHIFASPRWGLDAGLQNLQLFGYRRGALAGLLVPWDLLANARAFGEGLGPGVAGALVWLGLPWGALAGRTPRARAVWAAWGVILPAGALTLAVAHYLRYLLPLFAPLAVVAALNVELVWRWAAARRRSVATAVAVALGLLYVGGSRLAHTAMLWPIPERFPFGVAFGLEREEDFLSRAVREYAALRHLDSLVEENARVVGVGCHGRLYTRARLYEAAWGRHELTDVMRAGARGAALAQALAQRGFDAMIVNREVVLASGWQTVPVLDGAFMEDHAVPAFADRGMEVYRLSSMPPGGKAAAGNLLANPGFEALREDGPVTAWQAYGQPLVEAEGQARGGERAVLARRSDGLTQAVAVEAGGVYTLGHWTRADAAGQAARLQINWLDGTGRMVGVSIDVVSATSEWRWSTLTATAPAEAVTANVYVSVHEDSRVWFDDMCLVEGTQTTGCGGGQ